MNMQAAIEEPVSKHCISKHTTIGVLFSIQSFKVVIKKSSVENSQLSSEVPSEQLVES
jgi:hypothetical protein